MKHHGAGLLNLTNDNDLVERLKTDFRTADLSEADNAMLEYAAKLTLEPWDMEKSDVEKLQKSGFSDAAILDICQVAGYYAFVNRLADGLGVGLEKYW